MDDEGSSRLRGLETGLAVTRRQAFSIAGAVSCSINWMGPSGITVEIACL
jgi:hypothetical protein